VLVVLLLAAVLVLRSDWMRGERCALYFWMFNYSPLCCNVSSSCEACDTTLHTIPLFHILPHTLSTSTYTTSRSDEVESDAEDSYAPDHAPEHDDDNSADGEDYSDYSDDFEQENNNNSPAKGKKSTSSSTGASGAGSSTNNTNSTTHHTNTTTTPNHTTNTTTHYSGPTLAQVKQAQDEASRGIRERERVMNPLKESLAYSLLASQVIISCVCFLCIVL